MEEQLDLQVELANVRRQLAEATATAAAHKRQLSEAKAKAKSVIQRKMNEADAKVRILEDQNKLQSEELATLKPMIRQLDSERSSFSEKCENLERQLQQKRTANNTLESRCASLQADLHVAHKASAQLKISYEESSEHLQQKVDTLRSELQRRSQSPPVVEETKGKMSETLSNGDAATESEENLAKAKKAIEQLLAENKSLREQAESSAQTSEAKPTDSSTEVDSLKAELRQSYLRIEALSRELDEKINDKSTKDQHENLIREAESENDSLKAQLAARDARVNELQSNLEKSEFALREEREKVILEKSTRNERDKQEGDEKSKILEAKVSEMERVVASKQAEIGKVREKAKAYLRELNAEKRAMESKMKTEAESLHKELEDERKKIEVAERRAESASSEVDNCLALIRDKQKNIQMLQMTIATQRRVAEEASRGTNTLREEFDRYKERARLALRDKDAAVESVNEKIEAATAALRRSLEEKQMESKDLKTRLRSLEVIQKKYKDAVERADRAEAAADLLRKDASGMSNTNYTRVDELEEKVSDLEGDLNAARIAMDDAESQLETMQMRLEATEKALRGAEIRAEETERISQKTIQSHCSQIRALEKELSRARESAASAQRTAAAAAKALASPSVEKDEEQKTPSRQLVDATVESEREIGSMANFETASPLKSSRTTLAAAMAGHSQDFGLQANFDSPRSSSQGFDSELELKDRQISVLTSQIADLGALLDDAQVKVKLQTEQMEVLKDEIKNLDAKLAAAGQMQNGAPFNYLRTIIVRYLETDDLTLLPVIANVLSFTEEETVRVKATRGTRASPSASSKGGYFGLNGFLGTRG